MGELQAKKLLQSKGYTFVTQNFHTTFGEIDLIFTHGETIIFVEVKTRYNTDAGHPEEAVTRSKLSHFQKAAQIFLIKNPQFSDFPLRFDVVAITVVPPSVIHYEAVI